MKLTPEDRSALQGAVRVLVEILQQSPEVPERVEQWPERDKHLQGEFWEDRNGVVWGFIHGYWRRWGTEFPAWGYANKHLSDGPWTKTTDPSQPRRFDSIADIPEDVDRVVGKYRGYPCELARSPLSGTGWMIRTHGPYARQQWVEYMGLDEDDLTDIEEVIGHE